MGYTLFPDNDKLQVNGSAITATSTNVNGGTGFFPGDISVNSVLTASLGLGRSNTVRDIYGSRVLQGEYVWGVFETSPISLTSVADNGSGKCRFTLNTHGLAVGDVIAINGSTSGALDKLHVITAVTLNTFDTRVDYVASATAGDYTEVNGRFASMTANAWIMRGGVSTSVAETGLVSNQFGNLGVKRSIHYLENIRTVRTATAIRAGYWNIYTGVWSTTPTAATDALGNDHAARPTYAIPGELTYRTSGQPDGAGGGITSADYPAKTGG